ncbi:nuclease HARBI1 [Labeo rohita]|uniref:Nuclease HARBI1 n=1 Tax=Labeo rohita TaxID=84645 RepID=A0A498LYB7_LABRO|nr:nuclease HARBI1 [Labeo rohita]
MLQTLLQKRGNISTTVSSTPEGFPLKTVRDVELMEEKLANPNFMAELVAAVTDIGGATVDEATKRMMTFLLDHALSGQYNFLGRNGKREFKALKLYEVIYGGLKKNAMTSQITRKDAEKAVSKWLIGARDRGDGSDLRPSLWLSQQSITSLIAALRSDFDHGWETDIEVLVFLYWLAHAASYRVVSMAFDIPKSTVHDIVHRISRAVICILKRVITIPTPDDLEEVGAGFAQLAGSPAFCTVAGAIDGCHIRIKAPASDAPCYFNRKLFHSVQLQAITDHKGKFIDIFVGYPGSVHDARVLKNSPVYTGRLYPPAGKCILGDGGYPCLSAPICLITPYREPVQNPVQARFNAKHARARNVVERAFGMLKTCWRSIFFKALEVSPAFVPEVVACCAVLHNLCLQNGDIVDAEVVEDPADDPPEPQNTEASTGEDVWDNLAAAVSAPDNCVPALHEHDYL